MTTQTQPESQDFMRDASNPTTLRDYVRLFLSGFAMGASDIVPGVSGGTMAFILGVYENLINAIKSFNLDAIRLVIARKFAQFMDHVSLRFLIALGLGILVAVVTLSSILESLLVNQPTFIFSFFAGLIIASIIAIAYKVTWNLNSIALLVIGAVVAFVIVGLPTLGDHLGHGPIVLFCSGMIAICAMILPGISGSFILLILGQYEFILRAVKNRDIVSVVFVGLGAVLGILLFSRVLSWLLKHHENITIAALVGFMIGSLRLIVHRVFNITENVNGVRVDHALKVGADQLLIALLILIVGFIIVTVIDHAQSHNNPVMNIFTRK